MNFIKYIFSILQHSILHLYNFGKNLIIKWPYKVWGKKNITLGKNFIIQIIILLFFVFIAFLLNHFSPNSLIGSGDYVQFPNPNQILYNLLFYWSYVSTNGFFNPLFVTFPFYALLAFINILFKGNSTMITHFDILFLLYFSYISFYLSTKIIYPEGKNTVRIGSSLAYSLNNFTLTILTYSWGYTHQFLIYIFLPLLISTYIRILLEKKSLFKNFILLLLVLSISVPAFNNAAFLELILFLEFLLLTFFILLRKIAIDLNLFKRLFIICVAYLLVFYWFILANYNYLITVIRNGSVIGFKSVSIESLLSGTSSNLLNSFSLFINSTRLNDNILYLILPLLYFVILLSLLIYKIKVYKKLDKFTVIFLFLILFFILLSVRLYVPFSSINLFFYSSFIFSPFRSPDKIFLVIPFLYVFMVFILLNSLKFNNKLLTLIFFLLIIIPFPFYFNGIGKSVTKQDNKGYMLNIKIPKVYLGITNLIGKDHRELSIISLPYSVVNSLNWSNYPMWHYYGVDFLGLLYNREYISANTSDLPVIGKNYSFKVFNDEKQKPDKLLKLFQQFSGEYILYHNDIDPYWIKNSQYLKSTLNILVKQSKLELIQSNKYFDLYKINESNVVPVIYSSGPLSFQKINPTKYNIYITIKGEQKLVFNQSFDNQWNLFIKKIGNLCSTEYIYSSFNTKECYNANNYFDLSSLVFLYKAPLLENTHHILNKFSNVWTLNENYIKTNFSKEYYHVNKDGSINVKLTLYYKPQNFAYLGILSEGLIIIFCLLYFIFNYVHKK